MLRRQSRNFVAAAKFWVAASKLIFFSGMYNRSEVDCGLKFQLNEERDNLKIRTKPNPTGIVINDPGCQI